MGSAPSPLLVCVHVGERDNTGKVLARMSSLLSWNSGMPQQTNYQATGNHREMAFIIIRSKLRRAFGQRGRQSKPPQVNCKATNSACSAWLPAQLCSCHSPSPRAGYQEEARHWVTTRGDCGTWRQREVRTTGSC